MKSLAIAIVLLQLLSPGISTNNNRGLLKAFKAARPLLAWYALALSPIYGIGLPGLGSKTDFQTLTNRCGSRDPNFKLCNEYIAAPPKFTPARVNPAPVFDVSSSELEQLADRVVKRQPRITVVGADAASRTREYVQRTLIFQFPDVITMQFIPIDDHKSTLAAHSYSIYGASDLGVNSNRIKSWLSELEAEVASSSASSTSTTTSN